MKLSKLLALLLIAFSLVIVSCSDDDDDNPNNGGGNNEPQTLQGEVSGTLKEGTYNVTGNLIVPIGETWTIEPGTTLIFQGDGTENNSPEIAVFGTLIAEGTATKRIRMTVDESLRSIDNFSRGFWGGIQAYQTCNRFVLRYCDIEYTGGPAGELINPEYVLRDPGSTRYTLMNDNENGDYIVEHCHFFGIADDLWRPLGGRISFCYNLVEFQGETGGDCLNAKGGTVGVLAYNLVIGSATNGLKTGSGGDKTIQTNIDIYNNTVVTSGYRRAQAGRGGSINVEEGARGQIHNNLMANCRFGPRMVDGYDAQNTSLSHNYNFATFQSLIDEFYPTAGVITGPVEGDINSSTPGDKDPLFVNYTIDYTEDQLREGVIEKLNVKGNQDFRLKAGSPALGAGKMFSPISAPSGTVAPTPSTDMGCYPSNGNGNKF